MDFDKAFQNYNLKDKDQVDAILRQFTPLERTIISVLYYSEFGLSVKAIRDAMVDDIFYAIKIKVEQLIKEKQLKDTSTWISSFSPKNTLVLKGVYWKENIILTESKALFIYIHYLFEKARIIEKSIPKTSDIIKAQINGTNDQNKINVLNKELKKADDQEAWLKIMSCVEGCDSGTKLNYIIEVFREAGFEFAQRLLSKIPKFELTNMKANIISRNLIAKIPGYATITESLNNLVNQNYVIKRETPNKKESSIYSLDPRFYSLMKKQLKPEETKKEDIDELFRKSESMILLEKLK